MYSADLGKFLQTDPMSFSAGDVNIYRYCGNNPVNLTDANGEFGAVGAVFGAITGAVGGAITGYAGGGVQGLIAGGLVGAVVGAAVGVLIPEESGAVGAYVGGAVASYLGQVAGNVATGNQNPLTNVNIGAIALAGVGGAAVGPTGTLAYDALAGVTSGFTELGGGFIYDGVSNRQDGYDPFDYHPLNLFTDPFTYPNQ